MSATRNDDAVAGQGGEFHSSVPRSEPLTTSGHQPGKIVSEADAAPEFHAETLPAGSAPPESTFKPNNIDSVPSAGAASGATTTAASETLGGTTSKDVHTGYGHPGQGQTSRELRHDNSGQRTGLDGVGASGAKAHGLVDERTHADQRGLEHDGPVGGKGVLGGETANEQPNETAR